MADLNLGMKCIKYMLLTVNAMFVLTAMLILSIGTTIYAIYFDVRHFIHDAYFSPASLLIAIGIIMLGVSMFGCLGAAKESTAMINIFALLLGAVFILEIAAGFAAYASVGGMNEFIADKFNETMYHYGKDGESKIAIDTVQENLECCGVYDKVEWQTIDWRGDLSTNETRQYPESCYNVPVNDTVYNEGCLDDLSFLITRSAILLGTGAMTISFIQFIGIIFALMLAKAIRQTKTDRERRRWEIREQMINAYTQMEASQVKQPLPTSPVIYVPSIGNSHA